MMGVGVRQAIQAQSAIAAVQAGTRPSDPGGAGEI